MNVTFQGASDDCIEIDGCPGADEFYVNRKDCGLFLLASAEGHLVVRVAYGDHNGCWSVGFMPCDEGEEVPSWPLRFAEAINEYTVCVEVECPDDVTLTRIDAVES